jgi:heme-degrading monooxygenase HmoA
MEQNRLGQTAVIFTSERTGADEEGYLAAANEMEALAAQQPGYRGIESARLPSGFGITVSYWADEASAKGWKAVTEHAAVQGMGRERWYARYQVHVAAITRSYGWSNNV